MRARWAWLAAAALAVTPLAACAPPEPPTAVFLGDSDTMGVSLPLEQADGRWATLVSERFGWREVNAGCDGSGYTRPGQACTTTYRERIARVIDEDPEVIVVSGGVADLGGTAGEIEAAVQATFVSLRDTFPGARVYAVGAVSTGAPAGPSVAELNRIVQEQAESAGATYVDLGAPLAGRPDLVSADGRPNAEGHAVIAELASNVIDGG